MESSKRGREFDSVHARSDRFQHLEGPEAKGCELLVRSIDPDVGGGDENHVPWLELRSGFATSVVVQGVLILGLPE